MLRNSWLLCTLAVFLLSASGCVPFVQVLDVNEVPEQERTAAFNMEIYKDGMKAPKAEKYLGPVKATSCKHWMWDDEASTGNAMEQLRIKAYRMKADAVVHVVCHQLGTNLGTNCWSSVTCSGDAIKIKKPKD